MDRRPLRIFLPYFSWIFVLCLLTASLPAFAITPTEAAKLLASDGAAGDAFGALVSISGDRAVIGAIGDDDNGNTSGSAYVFVRDGAGTWSQAAKRLASDGAAGDDFGVTVSISDNRAVIGAFGDGENGSASGSAYVFERDGTGTWIQAAKLLASDVAADDEFGRSATISGDRVMIGAHWDDDNGSNSGSTYVFELNLTADTIKPVITLLGDNPQILTGGDTYTELNATAIDEPGAVDVSNQIQIDDTGVDTTTAGLDRLGHRGGQRLVGGAAGAAVAPLGETHDGVGGALA